jgi:carbon storage regulator
MLILKRKMGEGIDVGDNVRIVLKEISGGHVKIGIEAPTGIRVRRSETAASVEVENVRAANSCVTGPKGLGYAAGIADMKRTDGARCNAGRVCGGKGYNGEACGKPLTGPLAEKP